MNLRPDWLTARPIAHRGLHDRTDGRIENSPAAALAAVERCFAIECDVQLSADRFKHRDRQPPAEVLAELLESVKQRLRIDERRVVQR